MIYLLSGITFLLLILNMIQSIKIRRIVMAQADANKASNEHRQMTADHEKKIKLITRALTKL